MSTILGLLAALLAGVGLFFMLVAAIGVLRMPDLYTRMHAATKASTLGISAVLLAVLVYFAVPSVTLKVLLIVFFFFLTGPVGAHALGRAAYVTGIEEMPGTRRFDLHRARIICPTRGGTRSLSLHEKAVELARENRGELTFLYVIGRDLAESVITSGEGRRVLEELRALGRGIVLAAQEQARAGGVQARGEVRTGDVAAEIVALAREMQATLIVMGYPEEATTTEQHAAEEDVWSLADAVQKNTHAQVIIER